MLRTSLHTRLQQGALDFLSGIITFPGYEEKDRQLIERAFSCQDDISKEESNIKALLVHEATHLMDLLTTNWGAEYVARKNALHNNIGCDEFEKSLAVFMINSAEIESHYRLNVSYSEEDLNVASFIRHGLLYDNQFGPIIVVQYVKDDLVIQETPLSMLSLLEAHATSEEFLSMIRDVKGTKDYLADLQFIKKDFYSLLGDKELSEYSLLLYLTDLHLKDFLGFEEVLRFVSALSRFSLDASSITCGILGTNIRDTFENKLVGYDLSMDLCRGMSRQVIYFKTVLLLYGWLHNTAGKDRDRLLRSLSISPFSAIYEFFEMNGIEIYKNTDDIEFDCLVSHIPEESMLPDKAYLAQVSGKNREILKSNTLAEKFEDVYLPQVLLGDDTEAFPMNCIAEEHMWFVKDNFEIYAKLDSVYRKNVHRKFHPDLGSGQDFFNPERLLF